MNNIDKNACTRENNSEQRLSWEAPKIVQIDDVTIASGSDNVPETDAGMLHS